MIQAVCYSVFQFITFRLVQMDQNDPCPFAGAIREACAIRLKYRNIDVGLIWEHFEALRARRLEHLLALKLEIKTIYRQTPAKRTLTLYLSPEVALPPGKL